MSGRLETRFLIAITTVLLIQAPGTVAAAGLSLRGETCFERIYDAGHLSSHPTQKVRRIRVLVRPAEDRSVSASLDIWVRNNPERYAAYATCRSDRDSMLCRSEFDDRTWRISATDRQTISVINGNLWLNPWAYDAEDQSDRGFRLMALPDDRSWRLDGVPCPKDRN